MSREHGMFLVATWLVVPLLAVCNLATAQVAIQPSGAAAVSRATQSAPAVAVQPITLVKGPYLQAPRTDGLVICLEPSRNTAGKIVVTDSQGKQMLDQPFEAVAGKVARVNIAGLTPGTTYSYQVILASSAEPVAKATLTTLPPAGQLPVTFVATGDSRTNPATFRALCDAILKTHIPLVLHSGDFVYAGRQVELWNPQFFDPGSKLLASVPMLPAIGNHELAGSGPDAHQVYSNLFVLPEDKTYYSLDYGGVHLIVLDSCRKDSEGSDQYKWLIQDLAGCKATWKVAVFHHPWFDAGYHANDLDMRQLYDPVFVKYGVDLFVVGHDHNYQRTRPVIHIFEPKSTKPYWQIVSGGAGAPLYPVLKSEIYVDKCVTTNHFVTITAHKDRMRIVATALSGQELDSFEIRKGEPPTNPVPFEQIQLEEMLRGWLAQRPFGFASGESSATMTVTWTNPYPVPVKLRFGASDSERWELTTDPAEIQIDARMDRHPAARDIRLTLRCLDPVATKGDTFIGMNAFYEAPRIGSGMLRGIRVPIVTTKLARPTAAGSKVTIDGKLDEPCWSQATPLAGLRDYKSRANEPSMIATSIKTAADGENLYLAVTCDLPAGWTDRTDTDITKSDYVQIDLAPAEGRLSSLVFTPTDRRQATGDTLKFDAAVHRSDSGWTIECAAPLTQFGPIDEIRLNVRRHTNGKLYVLAPLDDRRFSYGTAAVVPLKAVPAASQPAPAQSAEEEDE